MRQFARLFDSEKYGQICVIWDMRDGDNVIDFFFDPQVEEVHTCSQGLLGMSDDDAARIIEEMTVRVAEVVVAEAFDGPAISAMRSMGEE